MTDEISRWSFIDRTAAAGAMMSGDHICEQHVDNIDVANWFIGRNPVLVNGFGGRSKRQTGEQFDRALSSAAEAFEPGNVTPAEDGVFPIPSA